MFLSLSESSQEIKTCGLAPERRSKITLRATALFKSIPLRSLTINNVQLTLGFAEYSYGYCVGRGPLELLTKDLSCKLTEYVCRA